MSDHRVTRGMLSPEQVVQLDTILVHHNLPKSSAHHPAPARLAYACLQCGSIGEMAPEAGEDRWFRDVFVEGTDLTCCGEEPVSFHSSDRVLVDPSTLVIVSAVDEAKCDCGTPAGYHTSDCLGHSRNA